MKKQGGGWLPVSRFLAVLLALVLESVRVEAVPVSISLNKGNGDLILTNPGEELNKLFRCAYYAMNRTFRRVFSARSAPH